MFHITIPAPTASRANRPFNPEHRDRDDDPALGKQGLVVNPYGSEHAAKTARATVHTVFGRHARALDQANFVDRLPDQDSRRIDGQPARGAV